MLTRGLVVFLIFIPGFLAAQPFSIEGVVVDAVTKEKITGVSVFINQSYQSVQNDSSGKYSFEKIKDQTFEVVVSKKGYLTLVHRITASIAKTSIRFELIKQDTATITYDEDGWRKWGKYFLANLLGPSANAAECELLNPEVLRFAFNDSLKELTVTADDFLMIINDGLGYMLNYRLNSFIASSSLGTVFMSGYVSFRDLTTKTQMVKDKWKQRRQEAYLGSSMHFMRSLYQNKLEQNGYELHSLKRVFEDQPGFVTRKKSKNGVVFTSGSMLVNGKSKKFVYLLDKNKLSVDSVRKADINNSTCYFVYPHAVQVIFKDEKEDLQYTLQISQTATAGPQTSYLQTLNPISVQLDGLYFEPDDLKILGYMQWEKLAEKLPIEYTGD